MVLRRLRVGVGRRAGGGRPVSDLPVVLTVDDDPSVSRAVARDLRRRYAETHRVVRAESGESALEALKELRLRGTPVAALLADYRMPDMDGITFLEQAMDLFPRARRALLTAYADTDAAIRAINVVDVDHYLLKPWDPPEEKLYPVVDALLESWAASHEEITEGLRLVGHRWSQASHVVRDFLARNAAPVPLGAGRRARGRPPARLRVLRPRRTSRCWSTPRGPRTSAPTWPRWPRSPGCPPPRRRSSTTSSSSAAARPAWAPRSTAPPRACARCWSRRARPAGRPASRRGSRTTSASPTGSPAASSPTAPAARPSGSGPRCSPPAPSRASTWTAAPAGSASPTARRSAPARCCCRPGCSGAGCPRPASTTSSAAASTTAARPPRPTPAPASTCTSSAGPTAPARRRCSSPASPTA